MPSLAIPGSKRCSFSLVQGDLAKGLLGVCCEDCFGRDNVAGPTLDSLSKNFGLQPLIGTLLAIISDARLGGTGFMIWLQKSRRPVRPSTSRASILGSGINLRPIRSVSATSLPYFLGLGL